MFVCPADLSSGSASTGRLRPVSRTGKKNQVAPSGGGRVQ